MSTLEPPTFTVVVAAYDAQATIGDALRSVAAQARADVEVVVVDDGSTDGTAERAEAFHDVLDLRVLRQPNRGPAAARNAGIALARGRYVSMLDSDDLWLPSYLDRMEAALDAARDAGFAYTDAWALETASGRFRRATAMARQHPPAGALDAPAFLAELIRRNFVFNAVTIRREALDAVGGYAEDLPQAEDYELWLRLAASGRRGVPVAGPLAIYRVRPGSLSSDGAALTAGLRDAYRRVVDEHPVGEPVRQAALRRIAEIDRVRATHRGERPVAAGLLRARRLLGRVRRRVDRRRLLRVPPAEVRAAFPDLAGHVRAL